MPKKAKDQIVCTYFRWNLFRRDDGAWYADGRGNVPSAGKHSLGTKDRDDALRALRDLDRHVAGQRGLAVPAAAPIGMPIREGWEAYLAHCGRPSVTGGVGPKTLQRYRAVRDKHLPFCDGRGVRDWAEVDKAHVQAYGASLHKRAFADATVYLELTLLKQVVKWLIEERRVLPEQNRIRLQLRRSHESPRYCYTREQVAAMIAFCRAKPGLGWLGDVIVALATTGLRIGELAQLRWTDVDLEAGVLTVPDNRHNRPGQDAEAVRTTKGRRSRRLPVAPELRALLVKLPRGQDGRIFHGTRGKPLSANSTLKALQLEVIGGLKGRFPTPKGEVGFGKGTVHSFRHYFVSQAFLGRASESEIRQWVGHRDSRIVERYRHLTDQESARRMASLKLLDPVPAEEKASREAAGQA